MAWLAGGREGNASVAAESRTADLDIDFMTVHSAKGKEADCVIVIGMSKGKHGFPSEKRGLAILEFLLPRQEPFPFAEERRLFYVALTRARHRAYVVWDPLTPPTGIHRLERLANVSEASSRLLTAEAPCEKRHNKPLHT